MFRLATPWMLLALPPVLAAVWWMARRRSRSDATMTLPQAETRLPMGTSGWVRLDRGLPLLRGLAMILLVVSLARPQSGERLEDVSTLGVDIVIALDVSGSMRAEDFTPKNRLEVAKRTIERFSRGRPTDRVGLVAFAALATTRSPLTQDHEMFRTFLEEVSFAPRDRDGTAIGLGLATAVNRLRDSEAESRVVVLVTDGVNNSGQIGPQAAADAAAALEVKVYTIGVGSEGRVPVPIDLGDSQTRVVMQEVELDEPLLMQIAESTGGRYFRATDPDGLRQVFDEIDELEKTEIESQVRVLYSELFPLMLLPALAFLLLERLLVATRLRRLP